MTRLLSCWLAALAALSGLLMTVPVRADAQRAQAPPTQGTRQDPRLQVRIAEMPNLVGMSLPEAQKQPVVVEFRLVLDAESLDSTDYEPGTIARQSVPAGQRIRPGTSIVVSVAMGGVEVPLVERTGERTALALLARSQLKGRVNREPSRGQPGLVVRQSPKAGTRVTPGSVVDITVSIPIPIDRATPPIRERPAEPPTDVVIVPPLQPQRTPLMPNLVGRTVEEAMADATVRRLQLRITPQDDPRSTGTPGLIVRQSVAASAPVDRGVPVTVWVATGVTVPELVGRDRSDAQNLLTVGRLSGEFSTDPDSTLAPGLVAGQDPKPGSAVPVGATVRVRVASGVVVPSVIGATANEARARLASAGLTVTSREMRTERSDPNTVFEQVPGAGQRVARGTSIQVSVALPPPVTVPDVRGRQRGDAAGLLTVAGLKTDVTDDLAAVLAPGLVTAQEPAPGTEVAVGTVVRLRVAVGAVVPALVGTRADEARTRVASSGLRAAVTEVRTDVAPAGTVFEQMPEPGQRVARGTAVQLSVALPPPVTVPDVRGRQRGDAAGLLTVARLKADVTDDLAAVLAPGLVTAQDPAPGTEVAVGTVVRLQVAVGVVVPSVAGASGDEARARVASSGLRANVIEVRTDVARDGTVFEQFPRADDRVARGSVVNLSLARPIIVTVPNLAGRPRTEAQSLVQAARLVVAFDDDAASTLPPDRVSRQDPPAGTSVEAGQTVRAAVATGVLIPSVVNRPVQAARTSLEASGLRAEESGEVNDGVPESTVIRQSPAPNARVARGSPVRLVVAVRAAVEQAPARPTPVPPTPAPPTPEQPVPEPQPPAQPPLQPPTSAPTSSTVPVVPVDDDDETVDLTWLIPWIVGIGAISIVGYRWYRANHQPEPPPPPPHTVVLDPHVDQMSSRLEVSGSRLIQLEVHIRPGMDAGEQALNVTGALLGDDRRIYE